MKPGNDVDVDDLHNVCEDYLRGDYQGRKWRGAV
jgi:hypothetical protein